MLSQRPQSSVFFVFALDLSGRDINMRHPRRARCGAISVQAFGVGISR